jgi:23S rRNA (guanosine2251-2'-O)-methyltransferase
MGRTPPPKSRHGRSNPAKGPNSGARPNNSRAGSRSEAPRPSQPRLSLDLYGTHAVMAAINNPDRVMTAIYATDEHAPDLDAAVRAARKHGLKRPDIHIAPRTAFDASLPRDAVHQGVGATAEPLPELDVSDLLRRIGPDGHGVIVMLDQVTDPHNMGAIIRSACFFGAAGIVVQRRNAPEPNAVMAKAACGALDNLPIAYETNLSRTLEDLKDAGFFVLGLDERGEQVLSDVRPPERCVIVLGAEGPGMRRLIKDGCDQLLRLPTVGPIASLNVSNAAAVALYHLLAKSTKN